VDAGSDRPAVEYRIGRPTPALAPWVEAYVGYRLTGFPPGLHRGVPSLHLTFIVSVADPIEVVRQPDPAVAPGSYRLVVAGLQDSAALIAHRGAQEGVSVRLSPLGSRVLLGVPAAALWNASAEAADVVGRPADELWERVQEAHGWTERFAAVDTVLVRLLRDGVPDGRLAAAWRLILGSHGPVAVGEVARRVGWTRQHLAARFRREFGPTPKLVARIARLERARRLLARPGASQALVAASCGYYDRAHMCRDFADLVGIPPGRLLEEDLPSFQEAAAGGPGDCRHEHDT
jgi:AraC-like DNA-binding protein